MREIVEKQNDDSTYIMEDFPSIAYAGHVHSDSDDTETELDGSLRFEHP